MAHKLEHGFDAIVLGALPIGVITQVLPPLAAIVSIIYGCIKIYESNTFQKLLVRFRRNKEGPEA